MRPKDILLVLDQSRQSTVVLAVGTELARRMGAHLDAVCPLGLLPLEVPADMLAEEPRLFAETDPSSIVASAGAGSPPSSDSAPGERAERIGEMFRDELRRHGLDGRFMTSVGRPDDVVAALSRRADLVVLGQPEPGQAHARAHRHMMEDVLMTSGRPVLMIPFAGEFAAVGRNVLIGWSEKPEAARAAHDAMELADTGAQFTVLTVRHGPRPAEPGEPQGAEMARHIARHGFAARAAETVNEASLPAAFIVRPALTEADALLNYATDIGADLLAVGCYGHSRTREMVLGGVTRDLIDHMTLPVLMSR